MQLVTRRGTAAGRFALVSTLDEGPRPGPEVTSGSSRLGVFLLALAYGQDGESTLAIRGTGCEQPRCLWVGNQPTRGGHNNKKGAGRTGHSLPILETSYRLRTSLWIRFFTIPKSGCAASPPHIACIDASDNGCPSVHRKECRSGGFMRVLPQRYENQNNSMHWSSIARVCTT